MLLKISHVTMKALLCVPGFCTPISSENSKDLWESNHLIFVLVRNFSTYLYQIISSLWKIPYSGCKGKHAVVLVT